MDSNGDRSSDSNVSVHLLGTVRVDGPSTGGNSSGTCSGCSGSVILQ